MKKIKLVIGITLLFIVVGIAAVTTNLIINVSTPIASNQDDFLVYFSDAKADGEQDVFLVKNEKELVFNSEFSAVGDKKVIDYDVTNASKNYDAAVSISCTESNNYLNITNTFDQKNNLTARSTRTGTLTVELTNVVTETTRYEVKCTITATAIERTSSNNESVPTPVIKEYRTLKATSETDTTMFRSSTYKQKIKTITFEDEINIRDNKIEQWDISEEEDNSIIAYVTPNEDDSTYYNLYIQSDKPMAANEDMSYWFYYLSYVDSINGLELLDTSMTTNMGYMFYGTGYSSPNFILDVSNFDTSNVTDMGYMFYGTGWNSTNFTLDVSNFDTSKVTDMSSMFRQTGQNSTNLTLDVSNFDTSNVTNMDHMFHNTGYRSTAFTLDVSGFDTSKVTDMSWMFGSTGYSNPNFTLDVSNFDTSNVTNMSYMFHYTGCNPNFTLDVSNFDTSNVTDMNNMFYHTGYFNPNFTLDVSNFDTSNVTNMSYMFYETGYLSTTFTLDVSGFDTSNVTNMGYMFNYTGYNSTKLNISITIRNPNVTSYTNMFEKVAMKTDSKITVNYTSATSSLVDRMIATKSSTSNVVKGVQVD